ncbi:hypothetical protein MHU86_4595 [Fragilaria crotonensis]|nr:hypothetical protein MHU86_4595 [Fragilaria crotonensis]
MQRSLASRNDATIIIKTAKDITVLFDRSVMKVGESHDVNYLLDLIDFYDGSLLYIMDSFGLTTKNIETRKRQGCVPERPWMNLMKPFSLKGSPSGRFEITRDTSDSEGKPHMNIDVSSYELKYLTMVLARCGFLISHPTLTLRVTSCKVQSMAFTFLGYIADNYVKDEDNEAGEHPGNAIYRQISDSWPAIQSRLEAMSNEFCDSQRSTVFRNPELGASRVFHSNNRNNDNAIHLRRGPDRQYSHGDHESHVVYRLRCPLALSFVDKRTGTSPNPYDEIPQGKGIGTVVQEESSLLQKRAQELLDFANALPEQNIEWQLLQH